MTEVKNVETTKIRTDLNDMVTNIELKKISTRYNSRNVAIVTLYNGETLEFKDSEGLHDLFMAFRKTGHKDFIKTKELIEAESTGSDDIADVESEQLNANTKTYICVLYTLANDEKYRLFPSGRFVRKMIDLYYDKFKEQQKQEKQNKNILKANQEEFMATRRNYSRKTTSRRKTTRSKAKPNSIVIKIGK